MELDIDLFKQINSLTGSQVFTFRVLGAEFVVMRRECFDRVARCDDWHPSARETEGGK